MNWQTISLYAVVVGITLWYVRPFRKEPRVAAEIVPQKLYRAVQFLTFFWVTYGAVKVGESDPSHVQPGLAAPFIGFIAAAISGELLNRCGKLISKIRVQRQSRRQARHNRIYNTRRSEIRR